MFFSVTLRSIEKWNWSWKRHRSRAPRNFRRLPVVQRKSQVVQKQATRQFLETSREIMPCDAYCQPVHGESRDSFGVSSASCCFRCRYWDTFRMSLFLQHCNLLWKRLCQLLRTFEMFRLYFVQFLVFVNDGRVLRPELMRLGCTNSRHSESHVSPGAVHWSSLQFKWNVTCEIPPARYFSAWSSKALWKLLGFNRPALKTLRMQHFIFSASQLSANNQPALKRLQQGQMKLRSKWKIRERLLHFPGCLGTVWTCLNLAWWQTFCDFMFCAAQMQQSMSSDSAKTAGQKKLRAEESARDKSMKIVCMKIQPIVPSECCRCFLKVSQFRSRLSFRCQP
jgi:hypothetical protein